MYRENQLLPLGGHVSADQTILYNFDRGSPLNQLYQIIHDQPVVFDIKQYLFI